MSFSLVGRTIQGYEVRREVSRGGMGIVYEAYETALQRPVALKVLLPHLAQDAGFVERFLREARTSAMLNHPNIVTVYAVGAWESSYFIAMEYVRGYTLAQLLESNKRFSVRKAVNYIGQAAKALTEAHAHGVLHRDLKPQNIMVEESGRVKVVDFGIAKALDDSSKSTQTGITLGTPAYMSPEQCEGKPLTALSDVYSLGVVLYELLAGKAPFHGETTFALMRKIVDEPLPPLNRPNVPPLIHAILNTMLAKDPAQRFSPTSALVGVLKGAAKELDQPVPAATLAEGYSQVSGVQSGHTLLSQAETEQVVTPVSTVGRRRGVFVPVIATVVSLCLVAVLAIAGMFAWAALRNRNDSGTSLQAKTDAAPSGTMSGRTPDEFAAVKPLSPPVRPVRDTRNQEMAFIPGDGEAGKIPGSVAAPADIGVVRVKRVKREPYDDEAIYNLACEHAGKPVLDRNDPVLLEFAGLYGAARRCYPWDTDAEITAAIRRICVLGKVIPGSGIDLQSSLQWLVMKTPEPSATALPSDDKRVKTAAAEICAGIQQSYQDYQQQLGSQLQQRKTESHQASEERRRKVEEAADERKRKSDERRQRGLWDQQMRQERGRRLIER